MIQHYLQATPKRLRTHLRPTGLIKTLVTLAPIVVFLWLLNQNYMIMPELRYAYRPGTIPSPRLRPETADVAVARLDAKDRKLHWQLATDTLRMTASVQRSITQARFRVWLKNINQPLIFFSAVGNPGQGEFQTIVTSQLLNDLDWPRLSQDGLTLWQRSVRVTEEERVVHPARRVGRRLIPAKKETVKREEPVMQFGNYEEFLQNYSESKRVAVIGVHPFSTIRVRNYSPASEPLRLDHSFRGPQTLYLYTGGEPLVFEFEKVDLNRRSGRDQMKVELIHTKDIRNNRRDPLLQQVVEDDGNVEGNGRPGRPRAVRVQLDDPDPGVYQLRIETSEDVIWRNIVSSQHILAFQGTIFFADGPAYQANAEFSPISLTSNSGSIILEAAHAQGLQTVQFGTRKVRLDIVKRPVTLIPASNPITIGIERGDFQMVSDGLTTISPAQSLPAVAGREVAMTADLSLDEFDYVIANYEPRSTTGSILIDQTHQREKLFLKSKNLYFRIDAPGLSADHRTLEVKRVEVRVRRAPIHWGGIPNRIIRAFKAMI